MNVLIPINYDGEQPTVSARGLHEKLHIETPFKKWIDRMCEYGFEEFKDFWTKMSESTGGRPSTEYDLSIDMAKQICMIQRSPEGKQIRQYFIDLEKAYFYVPIDDNYVMKHKGDTVDLIVDGVEVMKVITREQSRI